MNKVEAQRQKEIQQAEELLFAGPQALGFAKGLFKGNFIADWVMPYPRIPAAQQTELDKSLAELRQFLDDHLDAPEIDRQADIPREVIDGLGRVGVLGATAPVEFGGRGFTQMANCKLLEEIGSRCASTSVFVNAHHSIGIRALLLFGTHDQKRKWLPKLVNGEQLGAFALTEREAGSDAANVQMQAIPSEDGSYFVLNGENVISPTQASRSADSHGAHAGTWVGQNGDHGISGYARHAGVHNIRGPNAEDGNPRHRNRTICPARRQSPERKYSRPNGQRAESGAKCARFWPDYLRRVLHRRGENVLAASH
jgi:hypothetical protein